MPTPPGAAGVTPISILLGPSRPAVSLFPPILRIHFWRVRWPSGSRSACRFANECRSPCFPLTVMSSRFVACSVGHGVYRHHATQEGERDEAPRCHYHAQPVRGARASLTSRSATQAGVIWQTGQWGAVTPLFCASAGARLCSRSTWCSGAQRVPSLVTLHLL